MKLVKKAKPVMENLASNNGPKNSNRSGSSQAAKKALSLINNGIVRNSCYSFYLHLALLINRNTVANMLCALQKTHSHQTS